MADRQTAIQKVAKLLEGRKDILEGVPGKDLRALMYATSAGTPARSRRPT